MKANIIPVFLPAMANEQPLFVYKHFSIIPGFSSVLFLPLLYQHRSCLKKQYAFILIFKLNVLAEGVFLPEQVLDLQASVARHEG